MRITNFPRCVKILAIWLAVIISAVVFIAAPAFALAEKVNRNVVAGVLATGAIVLLASGVASAVVGERDMSHHQRTLRTL